MSSVPTFAGPTLCGRIIFWRAWWRIRRLDQGQRAGQGAALFQNWAGRFHQPTPSDRLNVLFWTRFDLDA